MKKFLMIWVVLLPPPTPILPLTAEELTADKNRFKLDISISYFLKPYSL